MDESPSLFERLGNWLRNLFDKGEDTNPNSVGSPGFGESFIPVWGPAREGVNDFQNGRYVWGTINVALAITDVFLIKSLVKSGVKLGGKSGCGAPGKGAQGNVNRMARPNLPPLSRAEEALRREAEIQQRILADRLAELGVGEGGAIAKGAKELPPAAANDPIAKGLSGRLRELRRWIAELRRNPPHGPATRGGWELD